MGEHRCEWDIVDILAAGPAGEQWVCSLRACRRCGRVEGTDMGIEYTPGEPDTWTWPDAYPDFDEAVTCPETGIPYEDCDCGACSTRRACDE